MILKVGMPEVRRVGKLTLQQGKKQNAMSKKLALPAKKELQVEQPKKDKILASNNCSYPEYEAYDYCTPLFP